MHNQAFSVRPARTANEDQQSVSVSTTSAATSNTIGRTSAVVYCTVECFIVADASPTATVAMGTPIPAYTLVPIDGFKETDKIAAITASGTGTLYIRPRA